MIENSGALTGQTKNRRNPREKKHAICYLSLSIPFLLYPVKHSDDIELKHCLSWSNIQQTKFFPWSAVCRENVSKIDDFYVSHLFRQFDTEQKPISLAGENVLTFCSHWISLTFNDTDIAIIQDFFNFFLIIFWRPGLNENNPLWSFYRAEILSQSMVWPILS